MAQKDDYQLTQIRKGDLAKILNKHGMTQRDARTAVDEIVKEMKRALCNGKSVQLRGFGTFSVAPAKAHTKMVFGKTYSIEERTHVKFRIAPSFYDMVNEGRK